MAVIVAVLIFSLFGVALAADPTADASRTIDPQVVERGEEVEVTVEFTSLLGEPKAFALLEDYRDGWEFTRGTDDASAFKDGPPPEWVWFVVGAGATKTVTYTLTVPMDAEAGNYTIEGTVTGDEVVNPVGGDTTITVRVLYDLTTSSTAGGSVTDPGEGTYTNDQATVVDLVATPSAGYRFDEWTGDVGTVADVNDPTTTITMNGDYSVTANFCELSTYQFIYDVPDHIVACEDAEMPVTFQTDVLGCFGYDNVRYKFYASGPGDVTFKVTDPEEVEHTFVNSGYWELGAGSDLPADYSETNNWTLHFSTPGGLEGYTVTFSLVDATTDETIAGLTEIQPLTVEPGDILNYYRSLHEPIDEADTLDLLAAADDWIEEVALPCFGEPITTNQLLEFAEEWIAT